MLPHSSPIQEKNLFETMASSQEASTASVVSGFLGIDIGTQGLSVLFCNATDLKLLAKGEASYGYSSREEDQQQQGWYEQVTSDWLQALQTSMRQVKDQLGDKQWQILAIGIGGQMHGEVLLDEHHTVLEPVRLWCDARNAAEGQELTDLFHFKVPLRATCARFLWTLRNQPTKAAQTRSITTPAGWMAWVLTGQLVLGVGDAAGMFPVNPLTQTFDDEKLQLYQQLVEKEQGTDKFVPLKDLLPTIKCAGQDAGFLTESGAAVLGLESHLLSNQNEGGTTVPIPVASAEGDQVAALAGSLIGQVGTMSCSFGTSVAANFVADTTASTVLPAIDHFAAANGKPIHMVLLRNGTTFLNTIVESYGTNNNDKDSTTKETAFDRVMPALIAAPNDCGGLLALPFMDDEPGLGIGQGGSSALILGWNAHNSKAGHVAKAALLSTIFNLKAGFQQFVSHALVDNNDNNDNTGSSGTSSSMREIVLSGGLTKTSACGQIVADVFNLPVTLMMLAAEEGCSWGACVMAQYRYLCFVADHASGTVPPDWVTFLESIQTSKQNEDDATPETTRRSFVPNPIAVKTYQAMFQRYQELLKVEPQLRKVMTASSSSSL